MNDFIFHALRPLIQPKETPSPPKLQKEVYPVAEIPANTYISEVAEGPTISSESKPITTGSMAVSTSGVRKLVYQQVQPWFVPYSRNTSHKICFKNAGMTLVLLREPIVLFLTILCQLR